MRLSKDFISTITLPEISLGGVGQASEPEVVTDTAQVLLERQQQRLAEHRQKLAFLVAEQRAGANKADEINQVYTLITGRQHLIANWTDLWSTVVAISWLGASFHRGLFTLGGWYAESQSPTGVQAAPRELLARLQDYSFYNSAEELRYALQQSISISRSDNQPELRKKLLDHLGKRYDCGPGVSTNLQALGDFLVKKKSELLAVIEDQLLFLRQRTFLFAPTRTDPVAGWRDFLRFSICYNLVTPYMHFTDYQWSIFLQRK